MEKQYKPRLEKIYNLMRETYRGVPDTYEEFAGTVTAPGEEGTKNRIILYKSLRENWRGVPDTYEEFAKDLFTTPREQMRPMKPTDKDIEDAWKATARAVTPMEQVPGLDDWKPQGQGASVRPPKDPYTDGVKVENPMVAGFSEQSRKAVGDTGRMFEMMTPQGRAKQRGLEIAGRMAGRNTRLPGLSVAMPTPEQPEASDGAQGAPKVQDMRGPQYYGTVVDQEDGQMKDRWLMPDGSVTTDSLKADVAAGQARKARLRREFEGRMAVNGLDASKPEDVAAQQAYDRLAQLEARAKMHSDEKLAKLEERYEKAGAMERGQMLIGQNGNTATSMVTMPASVYGNGIYDDEDKLIAAERKNLEDAITAHHAGKLKKTGSFFAAQNLVNAWEGVKDVFKDGDTYTAGMTSMHQSAQMLAIKAKLDKGEALTRGEESLLESMLVKQTIDENVEKPHGYTMGYTIANMVPFMIQMAMNPAAGAGGKLGNMAVKEFAKMMAKRAGQRATKGFMMKAVAKLGKKRAAAIAKGIGVTAGDIVASAGLANTLQAPATMADAALRHAGDVAYDKDGTLHFEGGDGVIKAFAKAEGAMLIEDYTEMLGVHFGVIGGAIGHGTGKAVRRLGGGKLLDNVMKLCANIRATDWAKGIAAIERRAQWNGSVGEVLEEEAGIVLNSIFTGDNSISDLWDKEQQIDIVLGVGAFGAFVSGIKTAGYPIARHKARKALDERAATCEASFGKNWESIRETIDMADEADLAQTIAHLGRRYATTPEKAKALLEYASAMAKARAFNIASASAEELQTTPEQSQIDQSYNNGYTAEGSGRADVQNLYNAQRERALNTLDADTMRNLNADPLATLSGMASAGTYTDEELSVAREYAAAKAAYDGMQQSAEDEIEAQIWRCNAAIDARTNRDTGMVQRATYGLENREVYIIKDNVVADENGVIDRSASDDTIAIVDLETGETKMVASKDLGQAEQPIAAEQFKSSMAAYVRQEIGDRARAQAEGRLLFEENEKCLILDDEGSQSEVTILGGATDEQGAPIAYAVKVQYADGTTGVVAMSELQEQVNAAAAARMDYAEQERQQGAAARAAVDAEVDTDAEQDGLAVEEGGQRRSFALNDEVELIADQGEVTSGMITEIDSDGFIDVQTDKPVNGQTVNHLTLDELMQLLTRHNGEIVDEAEVEAVATAGTPVAPGTKADEADVSDVTDVANVADVAAQSAAPTALERLPKNEKGEPIFENAESPEAAWDALVEFSEGDAATAKEIADAMAEEKRKAYEKVRKQVAKGKTPAELLASKKTIAAALAQAEGEYNMWQQIANVEQRRQDAIRAQQEAEAGQRAAERAEAEKAEREAREEAARLEREALEGIPEWHLDTPENARKRGVRRFSGQMFTRQRPVDGVVGREVEVKFSQSDLPKGRVIVIDASQLQPSHIQGARNPMFFIDEAQPKNRAEAVSKTAAKTMAENIRPQEITGSATAYTGAPTVNPRAEVIQGNNRSDALRYLWDNKLPNQQQAYKQYLIDNAERFSLDPEAIRAMERPVLVNMLDVDDAEAIRLGQMTAQDTESGGVERIKSKNLAQKLGEDMRPFASQLLKSGDEEATFGQLVDRNGAEVLKWMAQKGVITDTQYQSAFDSKGHLTAETKNDLQKVLYQAVFKGGSQQLEEMFEALPAKAQRAILSTAFRDMDSPFAGKMLPEIQASIAAYHQLMRDPAFVASKKLEDLLRAVETFKQVIELDDRFEQYAPADNFSNFALHLAAMYKAGDMSQTTLAGYFNQMYDLAQGKKAATLFEEADTTEYPLADVIKQVLNIDYKPAKNGNNNVANGGADVALRNQDGPGGELRGNEPPASGEQNPAGTKPSDRGAGTVLPVAERGGQGNIHSTQRPEPSNLSQTEAEGIDYEYVLSDEMDQNGRPFVLTSKGDLEFGRIERQSGLAEAPILLSEGIITNPKTKEGYGLIHIEARHGKQIRQNGYANAVEFIEDVANNWEAIMEAKDRNGNPTFRLIAKGKHNNTIMVELSGDGTYWNINTAGIFKTSYGKNAKELYSRHTTDKQSAETVEASQESEHSGTTDSSRMNASATTERKDNDSAPEKQVSGKESSAQTPENEAESGDKTLITEKAYQTIAERVEYSIEIRPNQNGDIFAIRLKKGAKLSEWKNAVGAYGIWSNDGRGEVRFDSFDAMLKYLESRGEEVESLLSKEKWAKREREINDVLFEQTGIREGQTWRGPDGTIVKIGARGFVKGPDGWDFATTVVYPDGRTESTLTPAARISEFFSKHGFESEQTVQTAVEAASAQVNTEPTPAQAEAGNYKKGHVTIGEFDITIENPAGSVRKGVGADGKEWSTQMANAYGYIKGTEGVDGDHIDVFLHSDMDQWNGRKVFVVDQTNTDGSFDEHKVMLGFNDKAEAMTAYLANYDKAWADTHPGLRISETNIEDFNKWVQASHRKTKPFADYTTVRKEATVVIVERGAPEAAKLRQKSSRLEIEGAEKLSAERAEAVERYVEGHYCAPIRVVADEADIRESGLSDVAVAQMMAALTEEDVPAVYCREDKKIYIFAGHKDSNVGSTLAHENFHALADAIGDARERNRMFEAYRKTLLADPKCGVYFKELWDAVINAYAPEEALEDFVGYTINRMYSAPGFIGHLERILDGDVKEYIFNKFINRIFNGTAQESSKPANQQGNSENDGRMAGLLRRGDSAGSAQTEGRAAREETGLHPQLDSRNRREQRGRVSGRGRTAGDSGREADGGADAGLTAAEAAERTQISGEPKGESNNFITPILYGTHTKTDAHRPTNPENRRGGGAGVQQGRAGNSQAEGRADGEESAGEEIANEPRRRYVARKQATTTGMSLFDWADAEERGRREVTTKDEKAIAAEETNAAIDGFVESYSRWLGHSAEIEAQLDAEGVEGELREELTAQMESEETRIAEERDKLEEKLRDYYATDNTPEDATRIARDMVGRVQAEVEIRHRKEHILSDLLNGSDEAPIETTSDEAAAEEKSGEVKTGGGLISYDALGHLPDAKEGEFAYVERKFSRTGEFSFTGADKIRDRGDVAYLFRSLENYSVENVFAVLVKDGKARVLHIGMGTATSSLADMSAIRAGVDAFGADRIYLIHNHPSGTMVASQQDRNLMRTLEAAFGDKIDVSGIIIDTTSGRYVEFDGEGQAEVYDRPRQSDGDKMADVFHFDQADRSNMPEETMAIRSSSDVANAIGNLRFGDGKKVSYLILAHNGHVIGNFHTEYTDINASGLAEELASVASKYGGTSVVVYGNMPLDGVMRLKDAVARHSLGAVRLLDTLGVRNGIRMSAVDEGMLYEDGTPYGPAEVREPMVAARGREAFDALRDRAVAERGIVMPGLNEKVVRVVEVPRHDFNGDKPIAAARRWAKESIVGEHILIDSNGNEVPYTISGKSIDKYLSETAIGKSANIGVHLAALKMLPEIIRESVEVEIHPDYTKDNHASRSAENDINPDNLIHRFYGAALIDGQIHRVKATIIENGVVQKNKPHSYEVTAVELINNAESQPDNHGRIGRPRFSEEQHDVLTSASSRANILGIANLLKGVEKSYDPGKKLLEESEKSELFRRGDERGSFADYSKIKKSVSASSQGSVGRDRFGEKRQAELAAQERERMAARIRELAERLHLDNVEVVTDASQLEGVRATAKGFFNKSTGKITIVLPNNLGTIDAEQTLLHEAVAHYGLRSLFGEHFDAFLDNVYESATEEIRRKIAEMAARNGWNFRTATEEYLAGLAENTDFEAISRDAASQSWWAKVKQLFIDMVERVGFKGFRDKVGVTLTDNELRYILWRSYANLAEPGATRSIFGEAADIAKQAELKVGNYAEGGIEAEYVEPEDVADRIEKLFDAAVAGDLSGGPIEIGRLTPEGRDFLEKLSGKTLKENVSFVLNPSDLVHIYRRHFGANEADSRNTPLTRWDIRQIAEIITSPDKVLYGKEKDGNQRNMFFFLKEAEGGSYNLMEVYADRRGNLTAKSFFKSKEGVSQRAVLLSESSTLTSVTDGATLLDGAKLPKFFDNPIVEEEDLYRPGDAGSSEALEMRQMRIRMDLASRQRDNIAMRNAALRSLRKKIGKIRRAMEAQRVYDFNTVGDLREVAMLLMRNESFLPEGPGEVSRLLGILSRGIGHRYTDKDGVERVAQSKASYNAAVESLMDLFVSNQLRLSKGFLGEMLRVRGGKVNSRGVEVAGELDVQGQIMVKAMRHYIGSSAETIRTRMGDLDEIIAEGEGAASMNAAAEKLGLEFARQYADEVKFREEQEELMRGQLDDLAKRWKTKMPKAEQDAYRQEKRALEESIRKMRLERAEALRRIAAELGSGMRDSIERVKEFRDREKARVEEIRHNASSDMEGRPYYETDPNRGKMAKLRDSAVARVLMAPAATFEQMMRVFGRKSVDGEGYLFDRFVRGWQECRDREWTSTQAVEAELNKKAAELLGRKKARWSSLYDLTLVDAGTIKWKDGGKEVEHALSQGNLMYMYMVDKMADGRVKLRHMGITEEKMRQVESQLTPELKAAADWLQEEFLPKLRDKYNEVHMRMFGAPMADIDNYFPLRILANSRIENVEMDGNIDGMELPKTMTGAIIKRRHNSYALDIMGSDAVSVALDHVREMETWAAFAEYRRDLCTLLSYKRFRNQVRNMTTIYGSGDKLWKKFYNLALLAGGAYQPKVSEFDKAAVNLIKLATGACINFRINTAFKQILSLGAFAPECNAFRLLRNLSPWRMCKSWQWAMKHMPAFQRRWQSRQAGNETLSDWKYDWSWTQSGIVKAAQRVGMTPNAFVDALTVAIGSEAVFRSKYKEYRKDGFSKKWAYRRALQDAEVVFNLSQQSSEAPYLSLLQSDRTFLTTAVTTFRNSSMSYLRQSLQSKREMANMVRDREEQIVYEFKKGLRMGLTSEQAKARAKRKYRRNWARCLFKSATYDFILPALWYLGNSGIYYLIFGDDDDKKKDIITDALIRGAAFGWAEGLTFGGTIPDFAYGLIMGREVQLNEESSPATGLLTDFANTLGKGKYEKAANMMINMLGSLGVGVSVQTVTDIFVAGIDLFGQDEKAAMDWTLFAMRVFQCPQSQMDMIYFDELGMTAGEAQGKSPAELAERYAAYKARRANFATMWAYDDERWDAVEEPWRKRFEDEAKARLREWNEGEVNEKLDAYEAEYKTTNKRRNALGDAPMGLPERAEAISGLNESPEGVRNEMYKKLNSTLKMMVETWLEAPTGQEAAADAIAIVEYKRWMVEQLDGWEGAKTDGAPGRDGKPRRIDSEQWRMAKRQAEALRKQWKEKRESRRYSGGTESTEGELKLEAQT